MSEITGVYRNGIIVPDGPVDLPQGKRVRIVDDLDEIEIPDFQFRETSDDVHDPEEIRRVAELAAAFEPVLTPEQHAVMEQYLAEQKHIQKETTRRRWGLNT
jgi:predicted DNA-binding antitoxin AbrB/MazE fold protein